jgi:hypothetical protein
LFAVETENDVFRNEPDGVIEIEAFDEFAVSFAQFVKKGKIARWNVLFIGHIIIGDLHI